MSYEHYKIIVAGYNCYSMIENCVDSIAKQTYRDFTVCLVDDASTDPRQRELVETLANKYGWYHLQRTENAGALRSQHEGITLMNPQDGDVIVWVDMDDALHGRDALAKLDSHYDADTPMTYGSYIPVPGSDTCPAVARYPVACEKANEYRMMHKWGIHSNHLRTVKWDLYKHLDPEIDFKRKGEWLDLSSDTAVMIPCLEMSGGRYKYISDVLYEYTSDNPISEWRKAPKGTNITHDYIESLPRKLPMWTREDRFISWLHDGQKMDAYGSAPHDIKMTLLIRIMEQFGVKTFVESGTSQGDAVAAVLPYVDSVHTIEAWHEACVNAFKRFKDEPKVQIYQGDSGEQLPKILESLEGPVLFWLDAHYSGDGTAELGVHTPITAELEALAANPNDQWCIIIDDARGFGVWDDYPTMDWIRTFCKENFPHHRLVFEADEIFILPIKRFT